MTFYIANFNILINKFKVIKFKFVSYNFKLPNIFNWNSISLAQLLDGLTTHLESFIQRYFREDFVTQDTIPTSSTRTSIV